MSGRVEVFRACFSKGGRTVGFLDITCLSLAKGICQMEEVQRVMCVLKDYLSVKC